MKKDVETCPLLSSPIEINVHVIEFNLINAATNCCFLALYVAWVEFLSDSISVAMAVKNSNVHL